MAQRPSREVWLNLALFAGTLVVFLIGAEFLLRVTGACMPATLGWVGQFQNRPSNNFIVDPKTGWRMRPNHSFVWVTERQPHTYRSNSQGFRSNADFNSKDPRHKIALVGDSYTFGAGADYENTFGALLERSEPGRVVWNFAMPGFGVDQVWLSARNQALPAKPDLLIVGLVNADFERSQVPFRRAEGFAKPTFRLASGHLVERTAEQPPNPAVQYLDEFSHLWALPLKAMRWVGTRFPVGEYWNLNRAILDALRDDEQREGVPVLFVYIPIKGLRPFPALHQYLLRTGANYIDLADLPNPPPASIYLPLDGHLSAEGHRFVSDLIQQWLETHMKGL